jgi:hypothetical protein
MPLRVRDRASSFLVSELQTEEKKTKKNNICIDQSGGSNWTFLHWNFSSSRSGQEEYAKE